MKPKRLVTFLLTIISMMVIIPALPASATDYCADTSSEAAKLWRGDASDWKYIRGTGRTGWVFNSSDDELIRAPRVGTLTFDTGQYLWSSSAVRRTIWIDHGTVWCLDKRGAAKNRPLSKVIRSSSVAASKYRAGSAANWSRLAHMQSEGWHFSSTVRTSIYVPFGHVDHEFGTTYSGNWTPEVLVATGWFKNS